MSDREAMELALEALEWAWGGEPMGTKEQAAMQALRVRLAAPEPGLEFMENSLAIRLQINRGKRDLRVQRFVRLADIERAPQVIFLEMDTAWKMLKKAIEVQS